MVRFDSQIDIHTQSKKYMDNKEHETLRKRKLLALKWSMADTEKLRLMENFRDAINHSGEDLVLKCAGRSYSFLLNGYNVNIHNNADN